jgi:HTH-type transcriptional regulator / antitoxin HigA
MTEKAPSYADLLVQIEPRPIRSKAALEKSYKLIDRLMSKPALSRAESEMLELLSVLVEQYESREDPTPQVSAAEMLEHLIESRGITNATLAAQTNIPRSTVTDILAGRRRISLGNVRKLADYFHVPASVFVSQETSAAESREDN